jgi:hypothetical protein
MKKFHEIKLPYTTHCAIPGAVLLVTCLVILAFVILPDRKMLLPPSVTDTDGHGGGNLSSCNIFKGEWVPDSGAPRYTTETCPVIHGHYDCIRYGRPDLGFVRWRWRPAGCDLPRLDAARFLRAMRGRSMAFVGDSLARNQMHSLVCLLAHAEQPAAPRINAQANNVFRFERHGFAVSLLWSPFLVRAVETDPDGPTRSGAGLWSLHLDEPDAGWAARAGEFDYVVVSAGSWFVRPSVFHVHGRVVGCNGCVAPNVTDLTLRYSLRMAFRTALQVPEDGGRAHALTVALREQDVERGRRLRAGAAGQARRVGDERGGKGHVRDTGGGVRGGEYGEQRGQDAAARRDGGNGAAAGRAPEQVSAVAARQVQRVARLFALVPARRHGRLQRHAASHVVAL